MCRVLQAEKLPASAGSADAICSTIQRAIAAHAPNVHYSAEVRVLSKSGLAAIIVANGRTLPERHFAVSDGRLNASSIERFATALANAVAEAGKS